MKKVELLPAALTAIGFLAAFYFLFVHKWYKSPAKAEQPKDRVPVLTEEDGEMPEMVRPPQVLPQDDEKSAFLCVVDQLIKDIRIAHSHDAIYVLVCDRNKIYKDFNGKVEENTFRLYMGFVDKQLEWRSEELDRESREQERRIAWF